MTDAVRVVCAVSVLGALSACFAPSPEARTAWPPADYYLEVRYFVGLEEQRQARFWADGLVVYREATAWLGGAELETPLVPVFDTVSAYLMRAESVRALARELERAGLRTIAPAGDAGDVEAEQVVVHWRAFGGSGTLWARGHVRGAVARVLHVINAFLPEDRAFALQAMIGEPEPRHVAEAPAPRRSLRGALDFHQHELLALRPEASDLVVDAFALALAAGELDLAAQLLDRLEQTERAAVEVVPELAPATVPTRAEALRRLLERRSPAQQRAQR